MRIQMILKVVDLSAPYRSLHRPSLAHSHTINDAAAQLRNAEVAPYTHTHTSSHKYTAQFGIPSRPRRIKRIHKHDRQQCVNAERQHTNAIYVFDATSLPQSFAIARVHAWCFAFFLIWRARIVFITQKTIYYTTQTHVVRYRVDAAAEQHQTNTKKAKVLCGEPAVVVVHHHCRHRRHRGEHTHTHTHRVVVVAGFCRHNNHTYTHVHRPSLYTTTQKNPHHTIHTPCAQFNDDHAHVHGGNYGQRRRRRRRRGRVTIHAPHAMHIMHHSCAVAPPESRTKCNCIINGFCLCEITPAMRSIG